MPTGFLTERLAGIMGSQSRLHTVSISNTIVNIDKFANWWIRRNLDVTVSIDGSISNAVAFNFIIPCLCRGMKIDTPLGPQPIESLKEGDFILVPPFHTRTVPIQRIFCSTYTGTMQIIPVRIPSSFFKKNIPSEDILISPNHMIFYDS